MPRPTARRNLRRNNGALALAAPPNSAYIPSEERFLAERFGARGVGAEDEAGSPRPGAGLQEGASG
jgi:hypothetical protein